MKKIVLFVLIVKLSLVALAQSDCNIFVPADVLEFDGNNYPIEPGTIICVEASEKDYIRFKNIQGSPENPVIIKNVYGKVLVKSSHHFGIVLDNCKYVKFTGSGVAEEKYGFEIRDIQGNGFGIGAMSSDIEVEFIKISDIQYVGLMAKTDPDCSFEATREKFTMYNLSIHDLSISNCGTEGMYIGSSKYTGQHLYECDTIVLPHLLIGVEIFNNSVIDTGWDGIQISSASSNCRIYGNNVISSSYKGTETQMSGILIGGGSKCDCYNNRILEGKGSGIEILGIGGMKIYNNLIVNPGKLYLPGDITKQKFGIFCKDTEKTTTLNSSINFFNNTIINPRNGGIYFINDRTNNNKAYNNCIIDPINEAYITVFPPTINMTTSHNFFNTDIDAAKFDDPDNYNYDLAADSPLVNSGLDLTNEGIIFDIDFRMRPYGIHSDIGAYEANKEEVDIDELPAQLNNIEVYPIPFNQRFLLKVYDLIEGFGELNIYDSYGHLVYHQIIHSENTDYKEYINLNLKSGIYILSVQTGNTTYRKKIVSINS